MTLSIRELGASILTEVVRHRLKTKKCRMLFIVGHMRSGSSLLVHLLAANDQIIGYGETHRQYSDSTDMALLARRIYRKCGRRWPRHKYVLDKILHSRYHLTPELVQSMDARVILLIRRPEETLPSIRDLDLPEIQGDDDALRYYVDRLADIARFARTLGPAFCTFLSYDELLERTGSVLQRLSTFLELRQPLDENYKPLWSTGKLYIGDPSETIKAGTIVRARRSHRHTVSESVVSQGRAAYVRCQEDCSMLLNPAAPRADSEKIRPHHQGAALL